NHTMAYSQPDENGMNPASQNQFIYEASVGGMLKRPTRMPPAAPTANKSAATTSGRLRPSSLVRATKAQVMAAETNTNATENENAAIDAPRAPSQNPRV